MADEMKVNVKMADAAKAFAWGAQEGAGEAVQARIAEITLEFQEFDASLARDEDLRKDLQTFLQQLGDASFGVGAVFVTVMLRGGSFIIAVLLVGGPAAYKFIKDYEQLHKSVKLLVEDMQAAKKKIEEMIRKRDDKRARK